jgi:hypothetical protein
MNDLNQELMEKSLRNAEDLSRKFGWLTPEMVKDLAITMFIQEARRALWK